MPYKIKRTMPYKIKGTMPLLYGSRTMPLLYAAGTMLPFLFLCLLFRQQSTAEGEAAQRQQKGQQRGPYKIKAFYLKAENLYFIRPA